MKAEFYYDRYRYTCSLVQMNFTQELKIKNHQGFVLAVKQGSKMGILGKTRETAKKVDVSQSHFYNVIKAAMNALELEARDELILEKNRTLAEAEAKIQEQDREIRVLNEQLRILREELEQLSAQKQELAMQMIDEEIRESELS
ncbi:MAG: hypothetical protein EAZ78_24035 [Oscillatoriales cyanobacterium]|uniref:Uncharacterized protein n=1 Tax=Microcoleus anatoxicus PTRS2 TaxID=2705321 RepID=A0ABU8YRX1_9CYAN|nr:MAG: hypothetical protein EA000_03175 [Oscillatoriales cyanobacterium]TAD92826.1 MAG: hypothetical protein EAZ98_24910 [Oscillatoriales cyanobacterium]TAE01314.1 MAG: hypothetical protein EAZ96_19440 [Oscillatoriales cyanobacterium]TAE98488.1 MAG: hypothetical protein EAZ78_24035 [Oscillatoriales cyanobacterium]TAF43364.1 MAG: hypothetical protein EAZ68_08105 [Oscillatoriales cyanobacterium]